MTAPIRCIVVSPERPLFDGGADRVVVPGSKGQIGVLPRHAPLIAKLDPGVLRIHRSADEGGETLRMAVSGGFVQVVANVVTLLVTEAVTAEEVDPAATRAKLQAVRESLQHPASDAAFQDLLAQRQSLQAQLSLVE